MIDTPEDPDEHQEWNQDRAARAIDSARGAEREWSASSFDAGDATPSAYIDGWNDALADHAHPLAEQLEAASKRIAHLERELGYVEVVTEDGKLLRARLKLRHPVVNGMAKFVEDKP